MAENQTETWLADIVLEHKAIVNTANGDVEWDRNNRILADVLLRADGSEEATNLEGVPGEHTQEHFVYTVPRVLDRKSQHAHGYETKARHKGIGYRRMESGRCYLRIQRCLRPFFHIRPHMRSSV